MKHKRITKEFKLEALRLLDQAGKSGAELARELGVRRNQLYKWRRELQLRGEEDAFKGPGRNAAKENVSELATLIVRDIIGVTYEAFFCFLGGTPAKLGGNGLASIGQQLGISLGVHVSESVGLPGDELILLDSRAFVRLY